MTIIKKTKEEKQKEIKTIISKLTELQLNTSYDGIKELFKKFKEYVDGEDSCNGKIKIEELNREIVYNFPQTKHREISVNLKYKEYH
jgi:hypothetical protein